MIPGSEWDVGSNDAGMMYAVVDAVDDVEMSVDDGNVVVGVNVVMRDREGIVETDWV